MKKGTALAIAVLFAAVLGSPGGAQAQEFKVRTFDIGGDGTHDYIVAEPGTGRVFVSRQTHFMVVDGRTGEVLGDIPDTPRAHGTALVQRLHRGFTTNAGDSTVTMFDLETLAPIKRIPVNVGGLDGIMYDPSIDRVILTNHSEPVGTLVAIDPVAGEIVATVELEDTEPEGAASDGRGRLFVNNEGTSTMQVIDAKTMSVLDSWPLAPCEGPTGIAYDEASQRIISACSDTSVVVDPATGKVVATIPDGDGVDGVAWDHEDKLIYLPAGRDGFITVAHQDSADRYSVVATIPTMIGARTITVDPVTHVVYAFTPEYGPLPPLPPGAPPRPTGRGAPRGPVIGTAFFAISH